MNFEFEFELGQIVYLKTDNEQLDRIVTGYTIRPVNNILYSVTCGTEESHHYPFEISADKDILKL